ncbi:MAG: 2-dehydropantoate 2-reductase [Acidobacteria bacterium]|nr:2-dehydropantoate 2-reductase [Acidobacteriota bacterium]
MPSERIAVLGAGAVGCYFGGMLARVGVPVTLIGRPAHVDAMKRDGLFIGRSDFQEYVTVDAHTEIDAVRGATIVLLCVKTPDTETAAAAVKPFLGEGALLVSMQNGVDNVERIRAAAGIEAIPAVVYVAVAMSGPGRVKHSGRGDLIIGDRPRQELDRVAAVFEYAGIPCRISGNIASELWTKLIMNCTYNAISAIGQWRYALIKGNPLTRQVMKQVVDEVAAVAKASGVTLPDTENLNDAVLKLGEAMANATSSTAQDIARGKPTEIDSLNGYIARRGAALRVPTPVNSTLYALVKLLEARKIP